MGASARLQVVTLRARRANNDLTAAVAATDDVEDAVDVAEVAAEDANARAEWAQAKLRASEQNAEWLRAVVAVARLRYDADRVE
eukprot:SAG11_NODE_27357_length_333_cov_1.645299_1_plen_83_part_10